MRIRESNRDGAAPQASDKGSCHYMRAGEKSVTGTRTGSYMERPSTEHSPAGKQPEK